MKRILFIIILVGLCASCQKNSEFAQEDNHIGFVSKLKVTATIDFTKVSFVEDDETHALKASWEVGDKIIGFDSEGETYGYAISKINDGCATLELITEGDYSGTATADPVDGTAMYMFYAPGAVKDSLHADKKEFTISIKEQSSDMIPALMKAQATVENGAVNLHFTNEMAIIAIKTPTMATADKTYTGISLFGSGVNTEIKFGLDPEGNLIATPQKPGRINKAVSLASDGGKATTGTVYIVTNPIDSPSKLTFLTDNGESLVKNNQTLAQGNYYYMTAPTFNPVPDKVIRGGFSVKDAAGVISIIYFSEGNLWSKKGSSANTWDFEQNSYDYRTYYKLGCIRNGSSSNTARYEWGLFGWSTDGTSNDGGRHPKTSAVQGYSTGAFKDWGGFIDNSGSWSTLTREQWKWLIGPKDVLVHNKEARECSSLNGVENARFMMCRVGSVQGLMLFPDVFTWPAEVPLPVPSQINSHTGSYADAKYTIPQYGLLRDAGVVFLPGKGLRHGTVLTSSYDDCGIYWSATQNDTATVVKNGQRVHADNKVFALFFKDKGGVGEGSFDNWDGAFVRLVSIVK